MALPVSPLATATVEIAGETVEYRSLSRAQALALNGYRGREDEAEVFILECGTGCTTEEAKEFRESNDTDTAGRLIDGILILSGLATDSPKT
jgi:hypothetical protein